MIKKSYMESIGKEIREILQRRGITLYRISKDLGIAYESLYRSLRENTNPRWDTVKAVLDYLGYEVVLKAKRKEVKPEKPKPSRSGR